jgi:hypothetical protein
MRETVSLRAGRIWPSHLQVITASAADERRFCRHKKTGGAFAPPVLLFH